MIFPVLGFTDSVTVTIDGYQADVGIHKADIEKDIIVISLHGKEKGRWHSGNVDFANELSSHGYTTYTPEMPWYGYRAPLSHSYTFLDALIKKVANGKKVVVAGHSQGAPYSLFYTTVHTPPTNVVASILLAPGHLLHRSYKIQDATEDSVSLAKQLLAEGNGNQEVELADFNKGGRRGKKLVSTTPNIYLSYFGLDSSPNFLKVIKQAKLPLLWIDGEDDRLAQRMDYKSIYETASVHPLNKHVTVAGGHVSMWENAATPIVDWLKNFE